MFIGLFIAWIGGIVVPLYPQISSSLPAEQNPYISLSAAVIGAGPFILYVIYQEYVKSPRFVIGTEEGETGVDGVYFDKIMIKKDDCVFPLIEAVTTVKNIGGETVTDASARVNLQCTDDSIAEQEYQTRWTGDMYAATTDIHPGLEKELVLFQIVPTQACISSLEADFEDMEFDVRRDEFFALIFDADGSRDIIETVPGEMFIQRPLNPTSEAFEFEVREVEKVEQHRFVSRNIPCPDSYEVSVYLSSREWSGALPVGNIPLDKTMLAGRWTITSEKVAPLREALTQVGW